MTLMGQQHYTKTESDTKYATISSLNGKADTNHTHLTSTIFIDANTSLASKLSSIESAIQTLQDNDVSFSFVASLPATGTSNIIYFVSNTGTGNNRYDEYVWDATNSKFEKIGEMNIDLSAYVRKEDIDISLNSSTGILTFSY